MKVENVKIYDLDESIIASGYPMRTELIDRKPDEKDIKRCINLSKAGESNGAHGQFLTGIRVAFDLTCTNKMWVEAERYRFLEFVSSQSTMHRITKFDLDNQYNYYVDFRVKEIMKDKVHDYNIILDELETETNPVRREYLLAERTNKYLEILYTNPAGFELTARMTTNYRCLKNIYLQRKDQRLPEWRQFCKWIETLPYFEEFIKPHTEEV